jgi:NADH-quinone oxidoreductase subunit L
MVAPTPVSALLHSATLVAAGAVLLVRIAPMLTPTAMLITGLVGGLTAVITGLVALAEDDLKRLLASSTSSQLGFMLLAVGAGSRGAALIHLLAHAAMKSALFMGAGSFQHARGGTAFVKLAGVGRRHRWTFAALVVSGLALAEAPPLAGFWSKEGIIAACFEGPSAWVFAPLALLGTALTGGYVARTLRLLWRGDGSGEPVPGLRWMGLGLAVLTALVLGGGPALRPIALRVGMPVPPVALDASLVAGLLAAALGLWAGSVRRQWLNAPRLTRWAREGLPVRGGFDGWVVRPTLSIAGAVSTLDAKIHEGVRGLGRAAVALASRVARFDNEAIASGVTRIAGVVRRSGQRVRGWQSGLVFRELLLASVGIAVLLVWMTAWLLVRS